MSFLANLAALRATALWNATIPRHARQVGIGETHVRWLHPTKCWRRVNNKRLGIG